jgi:hypothetical protein
MEAEAQIKIIRIVYSHEWRTWVITRYDENDDQVGYSTDSYRLSTAIERACRSRNEEPTFRDAVIETYYRDGGLRKTL